MLTIARDLACITTRCVADIAAMVALAAVLSGCGTVQRNEAHASTHGGFFLEDCLYRSPLTPGSLPLGPCKLLCTSPTPVPLDLITKGLCK